MIYFIVFLSIHLSAKTPERIVSLSPALTEILFHMGLGNKIVGTSEHSNSPKAAKQITRIGAFQNPNIEKIISLKPDIVLAFREGRDTISAQLKRAQLPLVSLPSHKIDDYEIILNRIGTLFHKKEKTKKLKKEWKKSWKKLKPSKKARRILIQLDHNPLIVAAKNTFLSEIIKRCGHKNAIKKLKGYPILQIETVIQSKPDTLLIVDVSKNKATKSDINKFWKKTLPKAQIFWEESGHISQLRPRLPQEAQKLCERLHL